MKKNILYLIVLVVVAAASFFILRHKKEEAKTPSDQNFAVENVSSIERIVIKSKEGKADLRREDNHWMINDRFKAMQPKVEVLLETINKLRVNYPVGKAAIANVEKELAAKKVKVELYHKGEDKPFKVYYMGGTTQDSEGTFMRMEVEGQPAERIYVIGIAGFNGQVGVRFFTDEKEWRDTGIFDYKLDDIKEVSVQYPQHPEYSFMLKVVNPDSFVITPTIAGHNVSGRINKEGVTKYLSLFTFLNAEMYDNDNPKKDSIIASTPLVSISVTGKNGETKQMTAYYMPLNRRSKTQFDERGNQLPYDLDKYYAVINERKDFVVIQDFVFGKIFRKYSDFFVPPGKQ